MEMHWRCRIVRMVGRVDDDSADRWIAGVRALETSGAILHALIHTNGGASQAATRVKNALSTYPHEVVADIPGFAWSAGTSIALSCDRIVLGPDSVLGPCDRAWTRSDDMVWAVDQVAAHEQGVPVDVVHARRAIEEASAEVLTYEARKMVQINSIVALYGKISERLYADLCDAHEEWEQLHELSVEDGT
jgi:ClpP class serine protease